MRLTATMFALLMALPAFADDGAQTKRIAVVVSLSRPTERLPAAPQMQQQAASLVEALSTKGGYADVRALIGPVASAETVMSTVRAAVKDAGPQGVILFAFSGYGVGGDFGEPVLLTQGASVARPSETGLDVNQLAEVLGPHGNGQQILVLIDAMHTGNVDGVALIGPTASEWPRSSASGLTVITPRMGAAGTAQAGLLPALTQAISVRADSNGDGQLSMAELFRAMGPALSDESGSLVLRLLVASFGRFKMTKWYHQYMAVGDIQITHSTRPKPYGLHYRPIIYSGHMYSQIMAKYAV